MKILQISTEFDTAKLGGAERMVHHLATYLSKAGHDVAILTCDDSKSFENVKIFQISKPLDLSTRYEQSLISVPSMFNFTRNFRIKTIVRGFDIVHIHNVHSYSILFNVIKAAKSLGKKVVWTPHDYWFMCPNQALLKPNGDICEGETCSSDCIGDSFLKKLKRKRHSMTRHLHLVNAVLPPSLYVGEKVRTFGMPSSKITVVPNGVRIDVKVTNPLNNNNILYVGYLDQRKGVHTLIEATESLHKSIPGLKVMIVGSGPEKNGLEKLIDKLNLQSTVSLTGRLSKEELEDAYASARIVVVPSIWPEVFGLVAAEALIRGIPVVASNIGALPEIVDDGQTGLLFEPNNSVDLVAKIIDIYGNEELIKKFSQSGSMEVRNNYSIDNYSKQVETMYINLVNSNKHS